MQEMAKLNPEIRNLIQMGASFNVTCPAASEAGRLFADEWTVEKIAQATPEELRKYSFDDQISEYWIKNAKREHTKNGGEN